jgi:hypothetical protein
MGKTLVLFLLCLIASVVIVGFSVVLQDHTQPKGVVPIRYPLMAFGAPSTPNQTSYLLNPDEFIFTWIKTASALSVYEVGVAISWYPHETGSVVLAAYVNGQLVASVNQTFGEEPAPVLLYSNGSSYIGAQPNYTEVVLHLKSVLNPGSTLYVGLITTKPIYVWGYPGGFNQTLLMQKLGMLNPTDTVSGWQPTSELSYVLPSVQGIPLELQLSGAVAQPVNFEVNVFGYGVNIGA